MFKRLLVTLLPFLATSCSESSKPSVEVRTIDPSDILFSLPTLCDPAPAVDATPPPDGARSLHEDDWRQIEFVARTNLAHIKQELAALTAFKQEHSSGAGWTQVYIRKEHPTQFAKVQLYSRSLPAFTTSGLTIGGGPPWGGTVVGGFALSDGDDWFIYGQRTDDAHVVNLAVSPGHSVPSARFTNAISNLVLTADLLLVDWYASSLVDASSPESVLAWARRYQTVQP